MLRIKDITKTHQEALGLVIVALPILIYWVYWMSHPSYWFNADPSAVYFLDSLAVFTGKSYVYVDHPGTPVQILGSLLLAMYYPFFENNDAFVHYFLNNPETFFGMTNVFLLAANLFCAILLYRTVVTSIQGNKVLAGAAISLLFFALHPNGYESLTFWSHNSFNFPFGTILLVWLYREMRSLRVIKPGRLLLLGFALGILSIAQIYFFAWLAAGIITITIYSLRLSGKLKSGLISGIYMFLGGVGGITAMLIPVYKELPRFIQWITGVASRLGLYGTGESGFYSTSLILLSTAYWWTKLRPMIILLFFILLILLAFVYWNSRARLKVSPDVYAMSIGLIVHIVLLLLFMTKAALKLRYSLSLAAVVPILVFMTIKLLETTNWKTKGFLNIFYTLTLIGVFSMLVLQQKPIDQRKFEEQDAQAAMNEAVERFSEKSDKPREGLTIVYAYAVPTKCASLLQSDNWTGHFTQELTEICPNQYSIWDADVVLNLRAPQKSIQEIDWDIVVWPGNGTDLPDYLYSVGAKNIPTSWHVRRSKWFFIHSNFAE